MSILEHLEATQLIVKNLAIYNFAKVQTIYLQFETAIKTIYTAGEGWIEEDVHRILDSLEFAAKKHQEQIRKDKSKTSFLIHPLSVAYHLLMVGRVRDPDIIAASFLHDTLEDTSTKFEEIFHEFGPRIANFVLEVTDDQNLTKSETKKLQILTASKKSAGAAQIKLADKWDNLSDLLSEPPPNWPKKRIKTYFDWSNEVIKALPWVNAALLNAVQDVIEAYRKREKAMS